MFDNDLFQRMEIEGLKEEVSRLRTKDARAGSDRTPQQLQRLRDEVAELALVNECDRPVARARPRCMFCGHSNAG